MKIKQRYLRKIEILEKEVEFLKQLRMIILILKSYRATV